MPTLTTLPLSLQARILHYLCDEEDQEHRSALRGTNCYLPSRRPFSFIILDDADIADSALPSALLAPALASPVLAAAAHTLFPSEISYLTDLCTAASLPLWVNAFAGYVEAVSVRGIDLQAAEELPTELKRPLLRNSCAHAMELFKALSVDATRLRSLDLVHVPFHVTGDVQDSLLSGLCTALESNRESLRQLALPIYPRSNLCVRAVETATLPYLDVFSVEMRIVRDPSAVSRGKRVRDGLRFLEMMQAVDGHADRARRLTTLTELRLLNMSGEPCKEVSLSGCSTGFFRAVRTLRASTNPVVRVPSFYVSRFFAMFRNLEYLHWDRTPSFWHTYYGKLSNRLREVHLCHTHWITGAQVGAEGHHEVRHFHNHRVLDILYRHAGKIRTLVLYNEMFSLVPISDFCWNLEYFSLYITPRNVHELRRVIEKCPRLEGLEILLDEEEFGTLCKDDWQALKSAIPRSHPCISRVAIQTSKKNALVGAPMDVVIDCFTEVVKRVGFCADGLVFRAGLKTRLWSRICNAICRILDTCSNHSCLLSHLEVEFSPRNGHRSAENNSTFYDDHERLRKSKDMLVQSLAFLSKVNLGAMHRWSNELPRHDSESESE